MSDAVTLIDVQIIDGRGYVWNADGAWRQAPVNGKCMATNDEPWRPRRDEPRDDY
jgi:hypothetical protein